MSFWKNLFNALGAPEEQLSEAGVRGLLAHLPQVHTEILQFFEPTCRVMIGQEVFVANVLGEFRDPSVAIVYGEGRGHAFVRASAVASVAWRLPPQDRTWNALVRALEHQGFRVKHIRYFFCEGSSA